MERMKILYDPVFLEHETGTHPENKKRLLAFENLPITNIPSAETYLPLYHTKEYIERVRRACTKNEYLDPDTIASPGTYNAAVHAVGAAVVASDSHDFALVRPPGHHAHPDHSSGFCVFNNIAIAVQNLVNEGKRVMIFDVDGHLGDGTEQFFYKTNKVLYWSIHEENVFPGGGSVEEIGEGEGKGYTINIPLPPGSGDDAFLAGYDAVLPIAKQFAPDVLAVSAGFDGFHADPLLHLRYSLGLYFEIGKRLNGAFPSIFAVLEGGYNTEFLPKMVENFIAGVNGAPQPHAELATDSPILVLETLEDRLRNLKAALAPYWKP